MCGTFNEEGSRFCRSCGARMADITSSSTPQRDVHAISEKSCALAIVLATLIPGAGQIYSERVFRGLTVLVVGGFISPFMGLFTMVMASESADLMIVTLSIGLSIFFLPWIYGIVDSYFLTKKWNRMLQDDPYTRPW